MAKGVADPDERNNRYEYIVEVQSTGAAHTGQVFVVFEAWHVADLHGRRGDVSAMVLGVKQREVVVVRTRRRRH